MDSRMWAGSAFHSLAAEYELCGTPFFRSTGLEYSLSMTTTWKQSVRYDVIHLRAAPEITNTYSKRLNKISWSRVSNAADWSSMTNTVTKPLSRDSRISLCTFRSAFSVNVWLPRWCYPQTHTIYTRILQNVNLYSSPVMVYKM